MTRVETLTLGLDRLEKEYADLLLQKEALIPLKHQVFRDFITSYFSEVGCYVKYREQYDFKILHIYFDLPDKSTPVSLAFVNTGSWPVTQADSIKVQYDSSSYSQDLQSQLLRMEVIGKVAEVLLDFQDDIIAGYNSFKQKYAALESKTQSQLVTLSSLIQVKKEKLQNIISETTQA